MTTICREPALMLWLRRLALRLRRAWLRWQQRREDAREERWVRKATLRRLLREERDRKARQPVTLDRVTLRRVRNAPYSIVRRARE